MDNLEVGLKIVGTLLSVVGVFAAIYNIITSRQHQKKMAQESRELAKLDAVCLLAARTEQRVNGLEGRVNSFENRVEKRIDQIAGDISKVKDLFTDYLIKH